MFLNFENNHSYFTNKVRNNFTTMSLQNLNASLFLGYLVETPSVRVASVSHIPNNPLTNIDYLFNVKSQM